MHGCHTLVTRLLRVLQFGSHQILKFGLAQKDKNFKGVESSVEVKILVHKLPLYNLFVGEKKKSCHFGMNFSFNILDRKECLLDDNSEIIFEKH